MMGYGGGWIGMGWTWVFGLLLAIGLILLIILAVRAIGGGISRDNERKPGGTDGGDPHQPSGHAREILAERYARGELTAEEYQERLRVLGVG